MKAIHRGNGSSWKGITNLVGTFTVAAFLFSTSSGFAGNSTNTLWLSVAGVSNGWVNLILHGTTPGTNYVLLSKQTLTAPSWSNAAAMTGALNQNWTTVSVSVGAQSSCFFRAQAAAGQTTSTILWLKGLTVSNNVFNGLIQASSPLVPYTLSSKQSLTWPAWNAEATFYGSGFTNFTAFSVPKLGRNMLFLRARSNFAPRIIGAGVSHNVVIRRDGTVWAWGANANGELGNGQWTDSSTPVEVTGFSNIVALSAAPDDSFTLALDANGKVWSWGANGSGQLGRNDGLYADEDTPAVVPGLSNIVAIAGGSGHAIALRSDGTVWAWGGNDFGDLGDGSGTERDYAAPVPGLTNVIGIASGDYHNFALCVNGKVWGWGLNGIAELGIGNEDDQALPVLVSTLTNAVALSGGYYHSIALLADGTIKAWGENLNGEIGNLSSLTPVPVPGLSNIIAIACGEFHNLFLDQTGRLWVWGNDRSGQLGDGGAGSTVPFLLTSVSNVTAIAGGRTSSMISTADGSVYMWGNSGSFSQGTPFLVDLYTNYSSDGSGLPDWWELQYFGHLGLDPNSDPVGDGWTLIQDYEQGLNPTNFITPPTPNGLVAVQSTNSTSVTLTWNASPGQVLHYIILRDDFDGSSLSYVFQQIGEVAGNVTTFVDNGSIGGGNANSVYEIEALYAGGSSPLSAQAYINSTAPATLNYYLPTTAQLVRNQTGHWQLMFLDIPNNAQTIALYWYGHDYVYDDDFPDYFTVEIDILVSSLTSNIYVIPDWQTTNVIGNSSVALAAYVQACGTNGERGSLSPAGILPYDAPCFVDGRQHLKQNLLFEIRGATITNTCGGVGDINYVESSIFQWTWIWKNYRNNDSNPWYMQMDDLLPFAVNYELHQSLYDPTYQGPSDFVWQTNLVTVPAPAVLGIGDPYWIGQNVNDLADLGLSISAGGTLISLQSGIHNLFGLNVEPSLADPYGDGPPQVDPITGLPYPNISNLVMVPGVLYDFSTNAMYPLLISYCSQFQKPSLSAVGDYFATVVTPGTALAQGTTPFQPCPLPANTGFAATNQTGMMLASVGNPTVIGEWAKYSIQGSSPTKYAYLGQYFTTNAFKVSANGTLTTTNTGIVSPYGEFFPTEPGPVAMITMPDIDTQMQATGIVQVISLALDANHDGTIDTTFNGPDFVSANHPFRFWTDQNFDRFTLDADDGVNYDDDVASTSSDANSPYTGIPTPDCNYLDGSGHRVIPCARDLQDFTRLWICGLTSNLVAALPAGSTITLNWGDVGNPNPNNPTIDLFAAADADGGIGYLTNSSTADSQVDSLYCPYIGRIGPGTNLQLNASRFVNNWAGNHFIWCGVATGNGQLTLTIMDANSNVLAKTSTYIQLVDIKQMYERWTVGDDPSTAPTSTAQIATNDLPSGVLWPFRYANPGNANTPYVLYVHGWNLEYWEKDRWAESAFKRLYWQGYQGRFGVFRWPTEYGFTGTLLQLATSSAKDNFDRSEYTAWRSATGLLNKLNDLNAEYPGHVYLLAHSMGNVVAGEALRLAGNSRVVNTYVASQAAVSAHTYDTNIANYSFYYPPWRSQAVTPNIYGNWLSGNYGGGAGRVVNFYNTNDYALQRSVWQLNQMLKPDQAVAMNGLWDYSYVGPANDPPPWNHFEKSATLGFTIIDFDIVNVLTNRYEVMGLAAESWTTALGATPSVGNVGGNIYLGRITNPRIWLPDPTGNNYAAHFWHSAEFRGDYWQLQGYWSELLGPEAFNLK